MNNSIVHILLFRKITSHNDYKYMEFVIWCNVSQTLRENCQSLKINMYH
jgi:hypothetical protein